MMTMKMMMMMMMMMVMMVMTMTVMMMIMHVIKMTRINLEEAADRQMQTSNASVL